MRTVLPVVRARTSSVTDRIKTVRAARPGAVPDTRMNGGGVVRARISVHQGAVADGLPDSADGNSTVRPRGWDRSASALRAAGRRRLVPPATVAVRAVRKASVPASHHPSAGVSLGRVKVGGTAGPGSVGTLAAGVSNRVRRLGSSHLVVA